MRWWRYSFPNTYKRARSGVPEWRMGTYRVTLVLADGRAFSLVDTAWANEIVRVGGSEVKPLHAAENVEVVDASGQ